MGNIESGSSGDIKRKVQKTIFTSIENKEFPQESSLVEFFNIYDSAGLGFIPSHKLKNLTSDICDLVVAKKKNVFYKLPVLGDPKKLEFEGFDPVFHFFSSTAQGFHGDKEISQNNYPFEFFFKTQLQKDLQSFFFFQKLNDPEENVLDNPSTAFQELTKGLDYDSFKFAISNIIMKFFLQKQDPTEYSNLNCLHFVQNYFSCFEAEAQRTISILDNEISKNSSLAALDPIENLLNVSVSLLTLSDKPISSAFQNNAISNEKRAFESALKKSKEYFNRILIMFLKATKVDQQQNLSKNQNEENERNLTNTQFEAKVPPLSMLDDNNLKNLNDNQENAENLRLSESEKSINSSNSAQIGNNYPNFPQIPQNNNNPPNFPQMPTFPQNYSVFQPPPPPQNQSNYSMYNATMMMNQGFNFPMISNNNPNLSQQKPKSYHALLNEKKKTRLQGEWSYLTGNGSYFFAINKNGDPYCFSFRKGVWISFADENKKFKNLDIGIDNIVIGVTKSSDPVRLVWKPSQIEDMAFDGSTNKYEYDWINFQGGSQFNKICVASAEKIWAYSTAGEPLCWEPSTEKTKNWWNGSWKKKKGMQIIDMSVGLDYNQNFTVLSVQKAFLFGGENGEVYKYYDNVGDWMVHSNQMRRVFLPKRRMDPKEFVLACNEKGTFFVYNSEKKSYEQLLGSCNYVGLGDVWQPIMVLNKQGQIDLLMDQI